MATKIVFSKDQLTKDAYNGAIRERKVLGYPQENGPICPYSNVFYWSHVTSDYGYIIPEHSHIGFEILTYVLKGTFETFHKEQNRSMLLKEGDIGLIKAGKGLRHSEKLFPRSEILQIWFDPDFDHYRRNEAELSYCTSTGFPVNNLEGKIVRLLGGKNAPIKLNSKDVSLEVNELNAGFHTLNCPPDTVISGYVLEGFIEINKVILGKDDFFKVEEQKEVQIISMVNSRIFLASSPYQLEYQTYAAMAR